MKRLFPLCILPVLTAVVAFLPGCVVPGEVDAGYAQRDVYRGETVSTTSYVLAPGDGYAGRGYYYGPRNTTYYQRSPGVSYYRTRESAPREYWEQDRGRSVSTTTYVLAEGDGYAGRGYYYGPRNTSYYQRSPGVTYYRTRESAPREYWNNDHDRNWEAYDRDARPGDQYPSETSRRRY